MCVCVCVRRTTDTRRGPRETEREREREREGERHKEVVVCAAMACSAVFVLDIKGRVLISRDYRGDVPMTAPERFIRLLNDADRDAEPAPIFMDDDGTTYAFVQYSNLYLLAVCKNNMNATSIVQFLYKLVSVFKYYFAELEEESIRDNFVIIYELLDEMMDFGYPQYSEAAILSEFIKTDAHKLEVSEVKAPMAVTNAVSWRNEGIVYKKNEVFLDVVEAINLLVNSNGTVVRSEVVGALRFRTYLSGMPDCKLGLNDKVLLEAQGGVGKGKAIDLEDMKFHQCVRLARFESDRTISFIPPDGEFDLMTYRLSTAVKPLIWVEANVQRHSRSRIEYMIKARSQFKERSTANGVEIKIPVPFDATNPQVRAATGTTTYSPEDEALLWKIKQFPGGKEYILNAKFSLPSIEADADVEQRKKPITVKFEIPYFTVSGIQVKYLKISEKSGYNALPWVRYITVNGDYEVRMS